MDILKQCQKWHEEDKHQKIVDALEAISAEERTPEMDMELARAYNNLADSSEPEGRKLLHQALELMQSHEEELGDTYSWNFRMGYAYYYLDQEGRALRHFEKALELHPGDDPKLNTRQDMEELIDSCKKGISLPQFWECFRERTENCWETFAEMEAELRQMMDEDKDHTRGAELVAQMEGALNQAFDEISFEMGFNGEKHELILTPEGDKVKLFELIYFQKHAPKEVLEHWNILVGRQPLQNIGLRTENGLDISGDDVQIWLEEQGENSFAISAYCEKLLPMLRDEEGRAWWMLTTFTDQVLGEIPHMRYIDSFDVLEEPKAEPSFLLSQLPDKLREQGLELSTDPEAYLESYLGYKMEPKQDPDADWRLDVMAGSTCCVPLINGYLNADNDFMDDLHADGAVAGFFCYPLDTLREEEGSQKIFDFRDKLEEVLTGGDGSEVLTLTGGATGLYCGYVDFIAWDIQEALNMAKEFFEGTDIPWAIFHTFRREAGSVPLKQQDDGTETENQDDELDETLTGMDYIPYTQQNAESFFQQLEQWNDEDEYTRCIQALNAIPENWRNYRTAYALARALENYAIIGDHDEGTLKSKGDKALLRAIEVLESVREEGQDKAEWNMRMAYGYQYLYGQEEKAIPYAERWAELDPEDENAPAVIRECKAEIRKRQRSRKKKAKFVPGDTPFEGFDLTNFWDDNWYEEDFAKDTKLCAAILTGPQDTEDGSEVCILPSGEEVNFYQVIPLYRDELEYKLAHDADALLGKMNGISFVVEPDRQDAITRGTLSNDNFDGEMDDASYHLESIEEKELPIDPINAYNHMAIYLRWCMEHDLMGEDFLKEHGEVVKQVKADPASVDLRAFIQDELDGCLFSVLFNQQGRAFAGYYYGEGDSPYYPADIDDNALRFFGPERYHSNEFQQEAYLFIPFDEDYYQAMAEVIGERFENWQGQDFDEDTLEPSEVAQAIMEYLDCECTYFPSMADDDPIMSAYSYAQRLGVREGFVPVLIKADDETLLECLVMNADPEHNADFYEFDLKTVEEYRKKMLSAPIKDGKAVLEELTGQRKEEAEDDDMDWEAEVLGEMEGGYDNDRFSCYWDSDSHMTYPLILAKIPVKNPWEIFAYLPFGNWNECPDTPDLMAVAKYWFEQHGAIPAAMSHDELEFELPTPISKERAMEVAVEQYGFCPDLDQNEDGSIGSLADVLWQSTVWYFWWD